MAGRFNKKFFNPEVFAKYMDRIPSSRVNKLIDSGVLVTRSDIKTLLNEQTGGNYITVPMTGRVGGAPLNYDGATNITADTLNTYEQSMVVVGRAKAWKEMDFSADITGEEFMDEVALQLTEYWQDVDQDTILATLKGIFSTSNAFTTNHIYDITNETTKTVGATTLNSAMQKACGDKKENFKIVITHSMVATNLENISAIEYLKYTDEKGVERDLGLATWNGRLLLIDDTCPVEATYTGAGVYTVTFDGTFAEGDKVTVLDETITLDSTSSASATAVATAVVSALGTLDDYTMNRSAGVITFTEKSGHYGAGAPNASVESDEGTVAVATTTAPTSTNKYVTYALGEGSITYGDVGAKTPYETDRDSRTNGGEDYLITRQRKVFAPYGFSFTKASMSTKSPANAELEASANWEMVKDTDGNVIDHKLIPIAKIVSLG